MQRILLSLAVFATLFSLLAVPVQSARLSTSKLLTQAQPEVETFFGTVLKNGQNYVLSDSATKTKYILDDSAKASRFDGMTVKVTGTLDAAINSIHVETIRPIV
jgi:Protein of unknown function (DUF5818)